MFLDYAVLGDDVVICNRKVAKEYLKVLRILDVECNLSKSIISGHALEFAKRFYYKSVDVSPLSFKELNAQGENLRSLVSFQEKWKFRDSVLLSLMRAGYHLKAKYLTTSLRSFGPVVRSGLLFLLRHRYEPFDFFRSYSLSKVYHMDQFTYLSFQIKA